ncbi:MAG: RsiV family protein [Lachnospiraceae bacterium]|nr:RsiV family protein [Lachnospiraceae bacterium]
MNHEKIDRMKQEYEQIEVPEALKMQVEAGIRKGKQEAKKGSLRFFKGAATVAAAVIALVISVNVSPTIAHAMEEVPLLGIIVKVVNFSTYSDVQDDKNMEANVDIPQVAVTNQDGEVLSDETDELNQEVKKYAGDIIESYQSDVASIGDGESGNEAVDSSYQVVTDNDRLFALRIDTSIVMGGSNQYTKIYNVDKEIGNTITLKDLFQEDSDYLNRISEEIKKQMKENMEKDSNLQYFLEEDVDGYSFDGIKNDVNFYVNKDGKLTIVFDKYEVAPGYMGIVEFTIPTSVVSDIVKDGYLK